MTEGTAKRSTENVFRVRVIDTGSDQDTFFHLSNLEEVRYDERQEEQRVSYTEGMYQKGPRAENVRPV
ncbi:MAG: cold shock domain-containing protein [Planctomycetota bacterium]|nr:cold shock domain-containing protein [Planctomycetota bacterium]